MNYEEWEEGVAEEIKQDSLWRMTAYRLALFMSDLGWWDTAKRKPIKLSQWTTQNCIPWCTRCLFSAPLTIDS